MYPRDKLEAASNRCPVAGEALMRIGRLLQLDAPWTDRHPNDIRSKRQTLLKPHVVAFLDWAVVEFGKVERQSGERRCRSPSSGEAGTPSVGVASSRSPQSKHAGHENRGIVNAEIAIAIT